MTAQPQSFAALYADLTKFSSVSSIIRDQLEVRMR